MKHQSKMSCKSFWICGTSRLRYIFFDIEAGDDGHITESYWCQGKVIEILPKTKLQMVKMLWNAILYCKGYTEPLTMEKALLPRK